MVRSKIIAAVGIVGCTIALRFVPFSANPSKPLIVGVLAILSAVISFMGYRYFRPEGPEKKREDRNFAIIISLVLFFLLMNISVHIAKI